MPATEWNRLGSKNEIAVETDGHLYCFVSDEGEGAVCFTQEDASWLIPLLQKIEAGVYRS